MRTKNIKLQSEKSYEYPLKKARAILQEDGTIVTDEELQQIVEILTLLAKTEAELTQKQRA
jgi:tRNA1(Val) A37 N6-methylase TrmN6